MVETTDKYKQIALELLKEKLGKFVYGVTVTEKLDHNEEASLFFEAQLDETAPSDLGSDFVFSHLYLRRELESRGEMRFPYLATKRRGTTTPGDIILRSDHGSATRRKAS